MDIKKTLCRLEGKSCISLALSHREEEELMPFSGALSRQGLHPIKLA